MEVFKAAVLAKYEGLAVAGIRENEDLVREDGFAVFDGHGTRLMPVAYYAAQTGQTELITECQRILGGMDIDNLLWAAMLGGQREMTMMIWPEGRTASTRDLCDAVEGSSTQLVQELVQRYGLPDDDDTTALFKHCQERHMLNYLLKVAGRLPAVCPHFMYVPYTNQLFAKALGGEDHLAVSRLKMFVEAGAHVNASDEHGVNIAHVCANRGLTETLDLALRMGIDIDVYDREGATALSKAVRHGHVECVRVIVERGGCPNIGLTNPLTNFPVTNAMVPGFSYILSHSHVLPVTRTQLSGALNERQPHRLDDAGAIDKLRALLKPV